jgi:hypothetical protein
MDSIQPLLVFSRSPSCALAAAALVLCVSATAFWWWLQRPRRLAETFRLQGIDGPPPSSFLSGNLPEMQARVVAAAAGADQPAAGGGGGWDFEKEGFDDYCKRIFPYFEKWRKAYGACAPCSLVVKPPSFIICRMFESDSLAFGK